MIVKELKSSEYVRQYQVLSLIDGAFKVPLQVHLTIFLIDTIIRWIVR